MAGREPKKVHLYKPDGSVVKKYPSMAEFARDNGFDTNYIINNHAGKETGMLKNGNVYSTKAIGRLAVRSYLRIQKSPFVMKRKTKGTPIVDVYNLENEHIMTFKNDFIARAVFPTLSYGGSGKSNQGLRFVKRNA